MFQTSSGISCKEIDDIKTISRTTWAEQTDTNQDQYQRKQKNPNQQ